MFYIVYKWTPNDISWTTSAISYETEEEARLEAQALLEHVDLVEVRSTVYERVLKVGGYYTSERTGSRLIASYTRPA